MLKLGFAFALALATLSGCATTEGTTHSQLDQEAQQLLGTWIGDWDNGTVQFSFTPDGAVIQTSMVDGRQFAGTFAIAGDLLTLDFGGGDAPTYRIEFSVDGNLEFVDQGYSFQQLSACGGGPESDGI